MKCIKSCLRRNQKLILIGLIKANALLEMGDHKATRKFCEENMHRDAIASYLQHKIGLTYQRQGMLPKALDIFQELDLKNAEEGIT